MHLSVATSYSTTKAVINGRSIFMQLKSFNCDLNRIMSRLIVTRKRHSVKRMYLRQRCFDGWVNKTILKPRVAAAAGRANTHFRVPAHRRYRRKQSGSGIWTIIRIGLKSWSVRPCPDICRRATFHPNPCTRFWVILLTDRQTNTGKNMYFADDTEWLLKMWIPYTKWYPLMCHISL